MAEDLLPAHPRPRPVSRRGLTTGFVALLVFGFVYGLVVREYQVEGNLTTQVEVEVPDPDIAMVAEPVDFDARTNTVSVRLRSDVLDSALVDDGVRLNQGVRITVNGADGSHEFRFPQGEQIGNIEVDLGTSGEIYAYPLDSHEGFIALLVETYERGTGGINETTGQLSASLEMAGAIGGWDISADLTEIAGLPVAELTLTRSFSNRAFAFVLVMMAASVVVLALIASLFTVTNRRRFEVALLTWNGAILFALPLLRTYLPGSPPIGAAMDIYLYLWLFVIAVISLVLMLTSWSQQRKSELLEEQAKLGGH